MSDMSEHLSPEQHAAAEGLSANDVEYGISSKNRFDRVLSEIQQKIAREIPDKANEQKLRAALNREVTHAAEFSELEAYQMFEFAHQMFLHIERLTKGKKDAASTFAAAEAKDEWDMALTELEIYRKRGMETMEFVGATRHAYNIFIRISNRFEQQQG